MIERFIKGRSYRCKEQYYNNHSWDSSMLLILDNKPHLCTKTGNAPFKASFAETGDYLWSWGDDFARHWFEVSPEQELFT